ncbi:MAG: AAA family ATPase [Candidatus Omnitrophica bacterium]|nr:AAA family ATPase [Candidatus Omnitrophota bacterium]
MKIGIAGKGGVGKTTLAGLICWVLKDLGIRVLAVDADPDANLGSFLGFPEVEKITPIIQMKELISERMEVKGAFYKLTPKIDDIPDRFMKEHEGIKLIVMGTVKSGDAGCVCPESTFLRRLLHQIALRKDEYIVVDFEAGVEHLGRGTAEKFDYLLIVVEPSKLSVESFMRIYPLAKDIGIKRVLGIANKIREEKDKEFLDLHLDRDKILGYLSFSNLFSEVNRMSNWRILKEDRIYVEAKGIVKKLLNSGG